MKQSPDDGNQHNFVHVGQVCKSSLKPALRSLSLARFGKGMKEYFIFELYHPRDKNLTVILNCSFRQSSYHAFLSALLLDLD